MTTIEKLNKQYDGLKELYDLAQTKYQETKDNIFDQSRLKYKLEDIKYLLEVAEGLQKAGIELDHEYFITDNIYLELMMYRDQLEYCFYVDDDSWLYDNYIDSHSGINEWITELIQDEYDLYSGSSNYSYAFNTVNLTYLNRALINERRDGDYCGKRPRTAEQVVELAKQFITEFTADNKLMKVIRSELDHKFEVMKQFAEDNE